MKKNIIITTCILSLLVTCKNKNELEFIFHNSEIIEFNEINTNSILGNPKQLKTLDSYLIYYDDIDEKIINIYDIQNRITKNRFFSKGEGPNDLLLPIQLDIDKQNKNINILQRQSGIFTKYDLDQLINGKESAVTKIEFGYSVEQIKEADDGYIAEGLFENGSIAIYDNSGNLKTTINNYPDYLHQINDVSNKYRLGQGKIEYNKENKLLIFASYFTGDIKFYSLTDSYNLKLINSYHIGTSSSDLKNRVNSNPENTPILETDIEYFTDVFSTDKYIYILYSGESMKNKELAKHCYILKFDNYGNPLKYYKSNYRLSNFCVNDKDNKLFGIALNDNLDYILVEAIIK